jgi:hypothetical protein
VHPLKVDELKEVNPLSTHTAFKLEQFWKAFP